MSGKTAHFADEQIQNDNEYTRDTNEFVERHEFKKFLTEENNWRCEWENYPGYSKTGTKYIYSIEEVVPEGYTNGHL